MSKKLRQPSGIWPNEIENRNSRERLNIEWRIAENYDSTRSDDGSTCAITCVVGVAYLLFSVLLQCISFIV